MRLKSLRLKLLIFSVAASLTLGVAMGVAWLYFQVGVTTDEINLDNLTRRRQIQAILTDEFKEEHNPGNAAEHVGRAFFFGKDIIKAEITTPSGRILAARNKASVGKVSDDDHEIREAVKEGRALVDFWALNRVNDLRGKRKIDGISPFYWGPMAQEFTAPVVIRGQPELVLHVYVSLERFINELRSLILVAALIILTITTIFAGATFYFLDRLIYKPIMALDEAAERITAGDTNARAVVNSLDEFGDLARRFNTMADSLIYARFQADTDSLTGLFNYRHLQNYLAAQIALAQRYQRDLTIAMLDIDHFKKVNDLYGHQTGDEVLLSTVKFIKSQLRQVDYVARYGGEEFVIIMPETDVQAALKVMERILRGFPDHVYVERMGIRNPVFVSIGVADFPYTGEDPTNLLAGADMALLLAKRRGRNQISYGRTLDQRKAG